LFVNDKVISIDTVENAP